MISVSGWRQSPEALPVRNRVHTLETKVKKLESALNLQLYASARRPTKETGPSGKARQSGAAIDKATFWRCNGDPDSSIIPISHVAR
jgi:hypothetical protein